MSLYNNSPLSASGAGTADPEARRVSRLLAESRLADVLLRADDEKQLREAAVYSWDAELDLAERF